MGISLRTVINLPQIILPFNFELHIGRALYIFILRATIYLNLALGRG